MHMHLNHRWDLTPKEAIALQRELSSQVRLQQEDFAVSTLAGVDVGFEEQGKVTRAAVVVLDAKTLQPIESQIAKMPTCFPYVPGLLSFRELPAVLQAFEQLHTWPDVVLCDGQGIAHPRRFGIACHLGLWLDLPTLGVGKTRLTGHYDPPSNIKGAWSPLLDKDEVIGAVLTTRTGFKPLFISPGHRMTLQQAIDFTLAATSRYKLPETTRWAHRLASGPHS